MTSKLLRAVFMFAVGMLLVAPVGLAQCLSGNITSEFQASGPYVGLYKYTIDLSWDIPQGLSNVTLQCPIACTAICGANWQFEDPAGHASGTGDCAFNFEGEFNCNGNPSIGLPGPVVKWDAQGGDCRVGTATLCFYVNLPPLPDQNAPVVLIKNGQNVCEGTITGDCPSCPIAIETIDWSKLKNLFLY